MSGQGYGRNPGEQEEIARLKKEKAELAEKLRILELEKEGIKVYTLSQFDGEQIKEAVRSRGSLSVFPPKNGQQNQTQSNFERLQQSSVQRSAKMIEENPRMAMYEAQAIAIEKDMEIDKMKEEMERLKKEKEEMFELLKRLGKVQEAAGTSRELIVRNVDKVEMDNLKEKDKEKETKINEMKKKNRELEERLRRLEMNRERESRRMIVGNPVMKQTQRNTSLVIPYFDFQKPLILSADRSRWIELQLKLPVDRRGGAVYLNEEIYLIEGSSSDKRFFNLDKNLKWIRLADMNETRWFITNSCLEWNGRVWVFGGDSYFKSVERYHPNENKWTLMPDMRHPRYGAAAAVWYNRIVVSGGMTTGRYISNTVECFNLENGSWTELPATPKALVGHSLVSYQSKLIIMGGSDGSKLNDVWQLDPQETNPKWKQLPSMEYSSGSFAGIVLDEETYAIGGDGERYKDLNRAEIFDGKQWRDGPSLPYTMSYPSAMIIPQHYADRLCNYKPE